MAMDLFLFPSAWEGLGIVLVEAQASGLPCLVSDAICNEVKVTNLMNVCSLDADVEDWVSVACALLDTENDRNSSDYIDELCNHGYDANTAAKHLVRNCYTVN